MSSTRFLKMFAGIFIVALAANVIVSFVWDIFFHGDGLRWDITTSTAVVVGLMVAYGLRDKK